MININDKELCCGCNACGDACPTGAIKFLCDNEGIWYPEVNSEKCINCNLCEKVCPIINIDSLKHNDLEQSICYAAENKNLEVVFDSTSGGLFSALADFMYKNGGYVGGAIFNYDLTVSQFISNDKNDLPKLRSSKYVQSNAENFYKRVKSLLDDGEKVLVCGTPCQMAALRAFLGRDYENLIIVDFVCLGINSPLVFRKYLDSIEARYNSPVVYSKAKSKEYGWRNLTQKFILQDGRQIFEPRDINKFTKGYIGTHLFTRPSCYSCKFKGFPRMSDITLADFWGIENFSTKLEKNLGTSLVMINSKKGESYFENIKPRINFIPMPFETILPGNQALIKPLAKFNNDREAFFRDIKNLPFDEVIDKYSTSPQPKIGIKGKIKSFLRKIKNVLRTAKFIAKITRLHIPALYNTIKYSGIKNLLHYKGIIFSTYCSVNIAKSAELDIKGLLIVGSKGRFPKSHLETRFLLADKAKLTVLNDFTFSYGADIEVLEGGHLIIHGRKFVSSGSNIGLTIICGEKIEIDSDVQIGRNVLIRDNNGGHFINRQGYRNTRPVKIGEKCWLCESCVIMQGVNIGQGTVIGAKSFVINSVPANCLVSGSPAKIIEKNILWKY